jgi:hypothetical protein
MQHGHAAWTSSMEKKHGHAYTLLKTLVFPLLSGFGLWTRVSSVVRQTEKKARISVFFFRARSCRFFCARFKRAFALASAEASALLCLFLNTFSETKALSISLCAYETSCVIFYPYLNLKDTLAWDF